MTTTDLVTPVRSPRRGILLMICGVALFSILNGVVKAQMEIFPVNQVVFFRNACSLLPLYLMLRATRGAAPFRTSRIWLHLALGLIFTFALLAIFESYARMPLADATAINFTQPLMVLVLSLLLGIERVRRFEVLAVALGLGGVLIMVQPGLGGQSMGLGAAFGLCGAALSAVSMLVQRRLSMTEGAQLIAFYTLGSSALLMTPTLFASWVQPSPLQLAGLIVMGFASGLCQYLTVRAFYHASASMLSPITYTKMFWAVTIGFLWFSEVPSVQILLGAAVVIASTVMVLRGSAKLPAGPA